MKLWDHKKSVDAVIMINESQIYSPQYHTDFASCFACDVMETISPTYCPISTALKRPAQTFTFSGKERDAESGLNYFGARYYNSNLSIWLSVDPMTDYYPDYSPKVNLVTNKNFIKKGINTTHVMLINITVVSGRFLKWKNGKLQRIGTAYKDLKIFKK